LIIVALIAGHAFHARSIDGYLSEETDVYHVHMFDATELEKDEMVVFDVPPAADPVCARQRGMEAISAALRSNSRAPRAPLAPGPQMMTRQQMEALGVEMQSHAGQRFAMVKDEGADCCDQRRVLGRATVRSKVS